MSPTVIVGRFFRRVRSTFLFICSTTSTWTTNVQTYSKRQNVVQNKNIDVQNLENIQGSFDVFPRIFFGTMRLFLKFFGLHQSFSPSFVSIFCNNGCQKIPKGPTFYIFRNCDTSKISFSIFFPENFYLPRFPLNFFSYFATNWSFTKFLQFWAVDIAATLAVPGLFWLVKHFRMFLSCRRAKERFCCNAWSLF